MVLDGIDKHFVVPEKFEGRDFTLNFDGVYMNAEVYVNGQKVGEHNYGYTGFPLLILQMN